MGKRAVVSGGGTGIGAAVARVLAGDGYQVTIVGRRFTLGAVYAPRPGSYGRKAKPRLLLRYTPDSPLPGGRVTVAVLPAPVLRCSKA